MTPSAARSSAGLAFAAGLTIIPAAPQSRPWAVLVLEARTSNTIFFLKMNAAFNGPIAAESANIAYDSNPLVSSP